MIKLEITAKVFLNIQVKQLKKTDVAQVLLTVEQSLNSIGIVKTANAQTGIRVHINSNIKQYY